MTERAGHSPNGRMELAQRIHGISHDGEAGVPTEEVISQNRVQTLVIPDAGSMRDLGAWIAGLVQGGDMIVLSGPLGAGKTTFAQGFGEGLGIKEPIVSPTFTIARELDGRFSNGSAAHLVHVDAYRLGGDDFAPGQDSVDRLLDELESLGLDEELENPGEATVVLMEWGEQMAATLSSERIEIHIDRPIVPSGDNPMERGQMTSSGDRTVTITPIGLRWQSLLKAVRR